MLAMRSSRGSNQISPAQLSGIKKVMCEQEKWGGRLETEKGWSLETLRVLDIPCP